MDMKVMSIIFTIIVGVAFAIPVITNLASEATTAQTATNEALTCTNGTIQTLTNDNILSTTFVLTNSTGSTMSAGNYTLTASSGRLWLIQINNTIYGSSCFATYDYYADSYQTSTNNRTITALLPILIAIALLAIVSKAFGLW